MLSVISFEESSFSFDKGYLERIYSDADVQTKLSYQTITNPGLFGTLPLYKYNMGLSF